MRPSNVDPWLERVRSKCPEGLEALFAELMVLHSPVVYEPQLGRTLAVRYLTAAFRIFEHGDFRYVRELADERDAVLEFEVEVEGVLINGVDMLRFDEDGKILELKVMIRPFQALKMLQRKMAEVL